MTKYAILSYGRGSYLANNSTSDNHFTDNKAADALIITARNTNSARRKAEKLGFGPTPLTSQFYAKFDVDEISEAFPNV